MQNNEIKESEILKKLHVAYLRYPRTPEVAKPGKTNHTYNWLKLTSIAKYFYDHPDVSSELKTLILSGHQLYCGSYGATVSSTDRLKRFENIKTPEYINNYIERFLAGTLDESLATCSNAGVEVDAELQDNLAGLEQSDIFSVVLANSKSIKITLNSASPSIKGEGGLVEAPTIPEQLIIPYTNAGNTYTYEDLNRQAKILVVRNEINKKDKACIPHTYDPWENAVKPGIDANYIRPIYNTRRISQATEILFVEGEKAADTVELMLQVGKKLDPSFKKNIASTTICGGASSPLNRTDFKPLDGKKVIYCPDNDVPSEILGAKLRRYFSSDFKVLMCLDYYYLTGIGAVGQQGSLDYILVDNGIEQEPRLYPLKSQTSESDASTKLKPTVSSINGYIERGFDLADAPAFITKQILSFFAEFNDELKIQKQSLIEDKKVFDRFFNFLRTAKHDLNSYSRTANIIQQKYLIQIGNYLAVRKRDNCSLDDYVKRLKSAVTPEGLDLLKQLDTLASAIGKNYADFEKNIFIFFLLRFLETVPTWFEGVKPCQIYENPLEEVMPELSNLAGRVSAFKPKYEHRIDYVLNARGNLIPKEKIICVGEHNPLHITKMIEELFDDAIKKLGLSSNVLKDIISVLHRNTTVNNKQATKFNPPPLDYNAVCEHYPEWYGYFDNVNLSNDTICEVLNILFPIRVAVPNLRNVYFRKNDLFISAESATGLLALADIIFMLTGKTLESKKTRMLVEDWCAYLEANNLNTATYVNGFKLIDNKIIIVKHDETTHYELTLNETSDRLVTKLVASERVAFSEHTRNFIIAPFLDSSKYHITYLADTFRVTSEDYLKVLNCINDYYTGGNLSHLYITGNLGGGKSFLSDFLVNAAVPFKQPQIDLEKLANSWEHLPLLLTRSNFLYADEAPTTISNNAQRTLKRIVSANNKEISRALYSQKNNVFEGSAMALINSNSVGFTQADLLDRTEIIAINETVAFTKEMAENADGQLEIITPIFRHLLFLGLLKSLQLNYSAVHSARTDGRLKKLLILNNALKQLGLSDIDLDKDRLADERAVTVSSILSDDPIIAVLSTHVKNSTNSIIYLSEPAGLTDFLLSNSQSESMRLELIKLHPSAINRSLYLKTLELAKQGIYVQRPTSETKDLFIHQDRNLPAILSFFEYALLYLAYYRIQDQNANKPLTLKKTIEIFLYQHPMMAEYIKGQEERLMSSINAIIKKSCFKKYGVIAEKISSTSKNIPNAYRIYCKTQQLDSVESLIKILIKLNPLDSETIFSGNLAQLNMRLVSQQLTTAPIKNLAELLEKISTTSVGEVQVESLPNHLYEIKYGNVPIGHTEVSTEEITLETKNEIVPLKFSEEEEKIIQAVMEENYATH